VPAGKYKLVVQDKGTIHNFHIFGAGVDKKTGIPETGKTVFRIRLKAGTYTIQCDAHSMSMNTLLTVT
jgi:plastocyanin